MWLTLATFVGYAVVYTVILKPLTPQNIVIGGASGAMPPVLGWAAITRRGRARGAAAVPDHLRCGRRRTSGRSRCTAPRTTRKAGLPMLPVTHGAEFTRLHVLLYTLVLFAATLLPFVCGMSGWLYLAAALVLGGVFLGYALAPLARLQRRARADAPSASRSCYLSLLFAALLVDHYLGPLIA